MARDRLFLLGIHCLPQLRLDERLLLSEAVDGIDALSALSAAAIQELIGRSFRRPMPAAGEMRRQAEELARRCEELGVETVWYWDRRYPPLLREIYDPPFILFCRGRLEAAWDEACVAVVGTRRPSAAGRRAAWRLGWELGAAGIRVVSGLARGIDAEAHRGALEAGGVCVAVLAHGPDTVYPHCNRDIARGILDKGGLLVSDYAPGVPAQKHHFPARNRLISGLSRAVVVAEAPLKSGALITAEYALEQGRELLVHKDGVAGEVGAGTRRLLEDGAAAVASIADFIVDRPGLTRLEPAHEAQAPVDDPGAFLAAGMEAELVGSLRRHRGDFFRSTTNDG